MRKLAALTGAIALAAGLGACSSSGSSASSSSTSAKATTAPMSGTETLTGQVTGAAAAASSTTIPLKLAGVVNTTSSITLNSSKSTSVVFKTPVGNLAVTHTNSNGTGTVISAAECRAKQVVAVTYTVIGSKSTGKFAGATGSGKVTVIFEADGPKYTSGSKKGQCNQSSNAQPLASGALATFAGAGPLTIKQ
jgi:hypothetical protein